MGRIVVTEFVSLDGVMEAPGGGEGYRHAGWTFEIDRGADGDAFKMEETRATDGLLLGRVTYEGFAAAWPTMQGEFADKFNGDAEVRRLVDAAGSAVEQHDRDRRRRHCRLGLEAARGDVGASSPSTAARSSPLPCSSTTSSTSCG